MQLKVCVRCEEQFKEVPVPTIPKIKEPQKFLDEFLDYYVARGLGSLSKRECDILVVHLLDKYSDLSGQKNQKASVTLGVTESRIRSLRYEAKLKFPPLEKDFIKIQLIWCLAQSKFEADKNRISFVVEDSYVRHGLQGLLKENGSFADNSFNSEIVILSAEHLGDLLQIIYDKKTADIFRAEFAKAKKKDTPSYWKELMKEVGKGACGAIGGVIPAAILAHFGIVVPKVG